MPSTYSQDLKLELMATGENAGTWGTKTNTNLNLVQQAISGYEAINVASADVALVMSNASISNARNMVLNFTGTLTANRTVTIPNSIEKFYILKDSSTHGAYTLTFKTVSGTGFTLDQGKIHAAYSDGTNVSEVALNTLGGTIGTAQIADASVTNAKLATDSVDTSQLVADSVTNAKVAADAINTDQLVNNAVTTTKIANDAVTNDKVADNAVNTAQIVNDAVTNAKVADNAIDTAQIVNDAVTNAKVADNAIDTAQIVNDAVTAAKLQRKFTISTASPSGGSDGDIWFKYS